MLLNFSSPNPLIFWSTIGAALLISWYRSSGWAAPMAFLGGFYGVLVGGRVLLAYFVGRARSNVTQGLPGLSIASGLVLVGFGVVNVAMAVRHASSLGAH